MSELHGAMVPRRPAGAIDSVVDGELVLLSPRDFGFFGAGGSGDAVWVLIDGERSVDGIVAALEAAHEAEPGVIRADTLAYLEALEAAGLIEY